MTLLLPATCATTCEDKRRDHVAWLRRARRELDVAPTWGSEPLHHLASGPVIVTEPPVGNGVNYAWQADSRSAHLPENSIDLIFTDPPYDRASVPLYGTLAEMAAKVLKPGAFCLAMSGGLYNPEILDLMSKHLTFYWTFHVHYLGVDASAVRPRGNPTPIVTRLKTIHAFVKGWGSPRTVVYDPYGGGGNDKRFHHWGQDEKSARYYIDCFSAENDLVLDPFCGGGTTPYVCQALNRRWIALDVDPRAVEITRSRIRNPFYVPEVGNQTRLAFAI